MSSNQKKDPPLQTLPTTEIDMNEVDVTTATTGESVSDDKKSKEEKAEEKVPDHGGLKRLKKEYGKGNGLLVFGATLFAFLNGSIMELFAVIFAEILDILANSVDEDGNTNFQRDSLIALFYFVGMGTGAFIFNIAQFTLWGIYGSKLSIQIRQAYFDALTRQEIGFHEIETSSKLNARLTTECFAIQEAVGTKNGYVLLPLSYIRLTDN